MYLYILNAENLLCCIIQSDYGFQNILLNFRSNISLLQNPSLSIASALALGSFGMKLIDWLFKTPKGTVTMTRLVS